MSSRGKAGLNVCQRVLEQSFGNYTKLPQSYGQIYHAIRGTPY